MDVIKSFADMLTAERGLSMKTKESYLSDIVALQKKIGKRAEKADEDDLKFYFHTLVKSETKSRTIRRKHSALKAFYAFLTEERIRKDNPIQTLEVPGNEKSLPKYLTKEEVNLLLSGTEDFEMECLLEILYGAGLRVSELVSLKMSNIKPKEGILVVIGKGGKERIIPIHKKALATITRHLKSRRMESDFLFPSKEKEGHLSRQAFFKRIKKLARNVGIDERRVSPHVLRHSFASHLLANDVDLRTLQEMLGHASITTTEIYTHIQDERLRSLLKNKHPLSGIKLEDI